MASDIEHVVQANDCLSKIAKEYGFTWKKIWDYGPNSELKSKRGDPNILFPGDIVRIPKPKAKDDSKPVDDRYKYIRKQEMSTFQLQMKIDGKPFANEQGKIVFEFAEKSTEKNAQTDSEGNVKVDGSTKIRVPGEAIAAKLLMGKPPFQLNYDLGLGRLAPRDTILGIQQRLNNLGFDAGVEDGLLGPRTELAVRRFQRASGLTEDGKPGRSTQSKLEESHLS